MCHPGHSSGTLRPIFKFIVNPQFMDEKGHTPLIKSVISNKTSVAKLWIDAGANLDAQHASDKVVKANLYDGGDEIQGAIV